MPSDAAREAAVRDLGLGGDVMHEAELARDRLGQEAAGGRGQDQQVPEPPVLGDEVARRLRDRRQDALAHEALVQRRELVGREARQRRQVELGELERARLAAL